MCFIALCAVAASGVAFVHPFGNPRVEPAKGLDTLLAGANMPADAKNILLQMRGLPLERDAVAGVCTVSSGIVAD